MIPRCYECGRVIGDYHDPDCKIRSDCGLLVTAHHCEGIMRDKALSWWRSLDLQEQTELAKRHFPEKMFILISTSSCCIERIWHMEMMGVKDETGSSNPSG